MFNAAHTKYTLQFHKPAGTSRGTLRTKDSWFVRITDEENPGCSGLGEISLIPGLSPDNPAHIDAILNYFCEAIGAGIKGEGITGKMGAGKTGAGKTGVSPKEAGMNSPREWLTGMSSIGTENNMLFGPMTAPSFHLSNFPAIQFGIETAIIDLETGGKRMLYPSAFTDGTYGIPINGLIWMGERRNMLGQIARKLDAGFRIIKLKVGALDFEEELSVLKAVRSEYAASDLEIRLDANGAWSPAEAEEKLKRLSAYTIHSLEQPIPAGNHEEMARLCAKSPIPIALDEELIGVWKPFDMQALLQTTSPAYIIIKPSLLGGLERSKAWIDLTEAKGIGWWITSALESNIGLNAIAQWAATLETNMPQGLGTGSLYKNNIPSPLVVQGDRIFHRLGEKWDLSALEFSQ